MKRILLISLLLLMLLSGCGGRRQSDFECLYCGSQDAYDYQIDGQTVTFCDECYEKEMEQNARVKAELKN